jgi:phenylpropionate dioxygenase-like ring-hydroxylating dioxygenase large terminal subunit
MNLKNFWYIACESKQLGPEMALGTKILDEWVVLYRDAEGKAVALRDRCLHRNARLSLGTVKKGELQCPYHGWKYGNRGQVTAIPSEGENFLPNPAWCLPRFATEEQDSYIYVQFETDPTLRPRKIPFLLPTYQHVRLKHEFISEVPNCAENFIDIPHTSFVHPNVFRYQREPQKLVADIEMSEGNVHLNYRGETSNFGVFSRILNREKKEIFHQDHYYLPNFTHVEYRFPGGKHFNITSQSIPTSPQITTVYTDLTYDYGLWNWLARPFVYLSARIIIGQDVRVMARQSEVTGRYGQQFTSTRADTQHIWIERIYAALRENKDPRTFAPKKETVEFWI